MVAGRQCVVSLSMTLCPWLVLPNVDISCFPYHQWKELAPIGSNSFPLIRDAIDDNHCLI